MFSNVNSSALEASSTSSLPLPQAAITQTERSSTPSSSTSLGYNFDFSASTESRHDRRISAEVDLELGLGSSSPDEPLPSYEEPPEYTTKNQDPATLAMYLFKFGFLFPPFWILGACILFTPLHAPDADQSTPNGWLPEKTEAERAAIIATLRKAELKWAWRCLFALLTVSLFAIAAGVTIWAILRS
ncbi:hypothetical protein Moror_1987 [Moniliophthora roreri MCA 2997]|uniref:Uncharacterized protein n=2 Tax=Moniliophthora roreri TaxID=221103 RepID=V2Y7D1_MONRO|nr:hypothetical protein Moror_1987 [Moniliophthora roreri MCA 2997]KAI3597817.1 hypothetical protein WG66_012519 [Moniliophthora roreri]